jgi:hypothetical protein
MPQASPIDGLKALAANYHSCRIAEAEDWNGTCENRAVITCAFPETCRWPMRCLTGARNRCRRLASRDRPGNLNLLTADTIGRAHAVLAVSPADAEDKTVVLQVVSVSHA